MARKPDSIVHTEERRARMQAESDEQAMEREAIEEERKEKQGERERKATEEETRLLTEQASLIKDGESRDQLLERIRQLREQAKPPGPPAPLGISAYQQSIREIEEEAGRQAVARAEANMVEWRKNQEAAEKERLKREGEMQEVRHPNPSMQEQFPTQGPAMGKKK
jgi:hypothetical protein